MESILINLLIVAVLGSVVYCVGWALGMDGAGLVDAVAEHAWILLPMAVGALIAVRLARYFVNRSEFAPGDHVVYVKQKFSDKPGKRAEAVRPVARGEGFSYVVRKPWTVVEAQDPDTIKVVTPGGKHHVLDADDPNLHHAGLIESLSLRLRWRKQFPSPDA